MDSSKAFGVEQALGRALAGVPGVVDRLRQSDVGEFKALLESAGSRVPPALVEEYLASVAWPQARAKLILAVKLALGEIEAGKGHEGGRGVRKG